MSGYTQRRTWRLNRWYTICNLRWRIHHSGTSKFGERSSFEGRIYFNASILVKMACIYKYEYEGTTNMMVVIVKKVNYSKDNSVFSIEVLQCPPRGATKDNLYVDICWFCFPSQLLHQSHWRSWTRNAACVQHWQYFSKKRKVGKHGHSSNLVAKTSIDAFFQQRPVSKPVVHQ